MEGVLSKVSYQLYTDGATSKNGSDNAVGGWAYILLKDGTQTCSAAEKVQPATNNICELLAIIHGCQAVLPLLESIDIVEVFSDSAYCINCANEKWYKKWLQNGWKTTSKEPVKNAELWSQLIPFFEDPRFKWIKVKGHDGNFWNETVDKLAVSVR